MGDGLEDQVSGGVPIRVIVRLELVDVEQDDAQRIAVSTRPLELHLQPVVERTAVLEAGQAVARGQLLQLALSLVQLFLVLLALGDVRERPRHPQRLTVAVPHRLAAVEGPAERPVYALHAVLSVVVLGLPFKVRVERFEDARATLLDDMLHPLVTRRRHLGLVVVPEDLCAASREVGLFGPQVPVPYAVVIAAYGEIPALLALLQRVLGVLAGRDVDIRADAARDGAVDGAEGIGVGQEVAGAAVLANVLPLVSLVRFSTGDA